jgi:hypothetical protein
MLWLAAEDLVTTHGLQAIMRGQEITRFYEQRGYVINELGLNRVSCDSEVKV